MKKTENLALKLICGIFGAVGIIVMLSGIITLVMGMKFKASAVEITAEISAIEAYTSGGETHHHVYVSYTYNGKLYKNVSLSSYSGSMYEGEEITILCDPEDPGHIRSVDGVVIAGIMMVFVGIIFLIVSVGFLIGMVRKSVRRKRVISSGRRLEASVEKIELNTGYTVNGQHPYIIYCTYRDDYKDIVYRFKSDNIWTNPELIIHPGDTILVYADENNYKYHYVDTESIFKGKVVDYT